MILTNTSAINKAYSASVEQKQSKRKTVSISLSAVKKVIGISFLTAWLALAYINQLFLMEAVICSSIIGMLLLIQTKSN